MQRHVLAPTNSHPQMQPVEAIQPMDALVVHDLAFATKHYVDALIPESRSSQRNFLGASTQWCLVPGRALAVPVGPRELRELASSTGTGAVDFEDPGHNLAPSGRLQSSFLMTSDKIRLSSVRSATRRFRRPISSRNWRSS